MARQLLVVAAVFILGVAAGALFVRGQPPDWDPSKPLVPTIRCVDPEQDLGTVWHTDSWEIRFRLVNEDLRETFEVGPIRGGCTCTSVTPEHVRLEPGQEATIEAVVDLEKGIAADVLPNEFTETVMTVAKDSLGEYLPLRMSATCVVKPSYRLTPGTFSFGTVVRGDTPEKTVEVECLAQEPAGRLEVVSAPEALQVSAEPIAATPNAFRLTGRLKPDAAYGPLEGRIRFRSILASGGFVTRSVAVRARLVDDLYALPSSAALGALSMGEERAVLITLQSFHGEPFAVEAVEGAAEPLTLTYCDSPGPSIHRYLVAFKAAAPGAFNATVGLHIETAGGRSYTVHVPVQAYVTRLPGL